MASQVALTNVDEVREDTEMVMKPYANWEVFLTRAPLSIALMGELIFISASQHDFSISKNPPIGGFKYIKYPFSFRASLMQVCNTGWHAFNEAHNNMDQIRLHTSRVSDYIKAAVYIIFSGNDKVVEKLLPLQLDNIGSIADTCVTLAESTENKFMEVIKLIEELLEASVDADKVYGDELKRVQKELEESILRKKEVEMKKEQSNRMMKDTSERLSGVTGMFSAYAAKNYAQQAYENSEKELTDILVKMRQCNLEKINFKTTIEMLSEGLRAMGEVKTQWEKMVQFFQMISDIITDKLNKKLKDFVDTADVAQELDHDEKFFVKDQLHQLAFQASNLAGLVNMLSGTYTEVSNKYLMDSVSNLGELMVIDKDDKELQAKREKMQESCKEAQQGIRELVEKNKKEYDEKAEARILKMDRELNAILPGQP